MSHLVQVKTMIREGHGLSPINKWDRIYSVNDEIINL